jgi:hypothetical protein
MDLGKEVFSGKKVSDIIQEIYERQKQQELTVKEKIDLLSSFIEGPGDAIAIIPHIKELLDVGTKNNEVLIKIVQLFKQNQENKATEDGNGALSQKEIQQLFEDITYNVNSTSPKKIGI